MTDTTRLIFRVHAIERMFQWGISEVDVRAVLQEGEVIEERTEAPRVIRLLLGRVDGRPIHVVAAFDEPGDTIVVITTYEPDRSRWTDGFRKRKSP